MEPILKVEHLKKIYGGRGNITQAVNDLSFCVNPGEYVGIMGASGSGKTTMLNCIATICDVTSGHIFIENKDITELKRNELSKFRREKLGFIFQDYNLLDTLTGYENIALALSILKTQPKDIHDRVMEIAKKLEIETVLTKYPYQMSGGQKQRIAIAGAIAMQTQCIVLDEPTAMLDPRGRSEVLSAVKKLHEEQGTTIIYITHFMEEAIAADRIILMDQGKIVMDGTPHDVFSHTERIQQLGLDLPLAADIAQHLRRAGEHLSENILTDEELIHCLSK